ncbi:type I inositol 1,4,5-trisphosphate 5-phosphatase 1-like [Pyrus ussuriensis x Pyrus communis]|uniref:Type I inositol 1,4,5-trisphosphate 5-phosphatase 1-like n=1 Tax=Pyrus ussuriensis x Pyrus communis TaxID=2448454 RepID=A0A5N5H132_9ROSA|nr:type I inositol 1,4,5-trisphosphate 5-phosphatase 1-like [Pyrus ussuriensis x Pyrus communis]
MKPHSKNPQQVFWPRVVMRKWLNISAQESDYSADTDEDDCDADSDTQEFNQRARDLRFTGIKEDESESDDATDDLPRARRRKSETFRAQYINAKEFRVCATTWNVGGQIPPDDLDVDGWLDVNEPADFYVIGLQEIVPLNAGNIFGAEDSRPITKWENLIRETLDRVRPATSKVKSFSDPPSPSKFKPADDVPDIEEESLLESDDDIGEEVHPLDDETINSGDSKGISVTNEVLNIGAQVPEFTDNSKPGMATGQDLQRQSYSAKRLDRLYCLRTDDCSLDDEATSGVQFNGKLTRMLSGSERIGLSWPEPPLNLLSEKSLGRQNSFRTMKSFKSSKSFRTYNSFKSAVNDMPSEIALLAGVDLESLMKRKRRSSYVRIVSKQMVGIFLTVWVRRSLRKHIQNVKVSTVGVGVMGYIGNKGSISVSMSVYQTLFCFVCTHLTAGEKEADEIKRNADVNEIHRRTQFHSFPGVGFPKTIYDHERIIWLGDLNYRLNLSYEKTRDFISKKEWSKLAEKDQLAKQFKKGRAFDGWSEGVLNFPPTYKYETNSEKYCGEDVKTGRRTPAWCDRILSYGRGMRLLSYRRAEIKLSDHRPVTATYAVEVEVFSPRKLQRALTFTDAEIENEDAVMDVGIDFGENCLKLGQDISDWER